MERARAQPGSVTGPTTGARPLHAPPCMAAHVHPRGVRQCMRAAGLAVWVRRCSLATHCPALPWLAVGVITPYREQRALLRRTFEEVCGKGPASEVRCCALLYCLLLYCLVLLYC